MHFLLLAAVLLSLTAPSEQQTIKSITFLPGSEFPISATNINSGIVVINYVSLSQDQKGLLCDDNARKISPADLCYALGYAFKGSKIVVFKGTLAKLSNVPSNRLTQFRCGKTAKETGYIQSCAFRKAPCDEEQLVAVICQDPRGLTTTLPPSLPTLGPVNCSTGASANMRLMDSNNKSVATFGRVEYFDKAQNQWYAMCSYDFHQKQASLVCNTLCSSGAKPEAHSGPNTGVTPKVILNCPATASAISDCKMDLVASQSTKLKEQCKEKDVAYLQCTPPPIAPPINYDPNAEVKCSDNLATVSFNKTLNPGLTDSSLILNNAGAKQANCFFNVTDTGTHIVVFFTLSLCGGSVDFNANETIFKNNFLRMFQSQGGILTHANITFDVLCTLKKETDVNSEDVLGKAQTAKPLGGTDSPTVLLKAYIDDQMTKELVPGQQIDIKPSTRVYVKVTETSKIAQTQMAVRKCWLTPVKDRNSATKLYLIVDGCTGKYVKKLVSVDAMTQTFVFQPILFSGYKSFYMHCNTKTCATTDSSNACSRSCTNSNPNFSGRRRRKRSVDISELLKALASRGISPGYQTVDRGPFYDFESGL